MRSLVLRPEGAEEGRYSYCFYLKLWVKSLISRILMI